jgi:hypothetical protein
MTRRVFKDHMCTLTGQPTIVDLISDANDEAEPTESVGTLPAIIDLTADSDDDT